MIKQPSDYEQKALAAIRAWKTPELSWFGKAMQVISWPLDKAGDYIIDTPHLGDAIKAAISGIVSVANDAAQWSQRPDAIFDEFRDAQHDVADHSDIRCLDLAEVDKVIGLLGAKYKSLALVEGAATGAAGALGIAADVPALITLNLRAIGEYATYCGFDVSLQHERLFTMNVLGLASSPQDAAKSVAMAQLVRIAQDAARKKAWVKIEEHAFVKIIQQIAKALGIRLTKAKLAQAVPVAGAVVGAGFNAYYTDKVCDAAYHLYRERFLAEKYGADLVEETVQPAEVFEPDYEEQSEVIPDCS